MPEVVYNLLVTHGKEGIWKGRGGVANEGKRLNKTGNDVMGDMPFKIVIAMGAGDERAGLAGELAEQGYFVELFEAGDELWEYLNGDTGPVVLLLDTDISGADTEELLEAVGGSKPNVCPLLITDEDTANMAAVWSSLGAWCYMLRPINWGLLDMHFERIKRHFKTLAENRRLCGCLSARGDGAGGAEWSSAAMLRSLEDARRAGAGDSAVLLTGEPGTDKRAAACEVHAGSKRREGPFVALDRESYSTGEGAGRRGGYMVKTLLDAAMAAQGGTLFVEEVFALSVTDRELLLKILRGPAVAAAEDEEMEDFPADVRVAAGTCANLALEVGKGTFPGELFNELSRRTVSAPPLRERVEDIPVLAAGRLEVVSPDPARPKTISPGALEVLCQYYWPGNERELFNVVDRAAGHCGEGELRVEDVLLFLAPAAPAAARAEEGGSFAFPSLNLRLEDVEREYISRVLEGHDFHRERTSKSLGISRKTLYLKIKEYGLGEGEARAEEGEG